MAKKIALVLSALILLPYRRMRYSSRQYVADTLAVLETP